jgi:hypothetical protein
MTKRPATSATKAKPFQRTLTEDLFGYNPERARALVSWKEIGRKPTRDGEFVLCERGTGETGWWHDHKDGTDYGGHPMDAKQGALVCRTCGVIWLDPPKKRK